MHNPPSPSRTKPSGTVTFLFTDIEGSTRHWEAEPEVMRAAFARQEAIIRQTVEANGGYAYKMVGDAFQAAFPTALQALLGAIDAQRALHSERWPSDVGEVKVRMALHTGVTEERGDDYVGPILNRVARLLSAGHGGQVLISEVTQRLVEDASHELPPGVRLTDLGKHRLKDLTGPEHIFQLVAPSLPSQFPPLKTLDNHPNNLPLQPTPLIGREREVAEVGKLVAAEGMWLLTLTGPGGTGKTRLALQVASDLLDDYADGVWLVDLATLTDAGLVAATIAQTLSVREVPGRLIADTLTDYLADKHLLLLLDNFEHVLDAARVVAALENAAPFVKVVVTSRAKLNIYGEHEYEVPPLSLPDVKRLPPLIELSRFEGVQLFIERAQAAKADFEVTTDNASAVSEICIALDGLPLAIELAAARVKVLPPQAILARLSDRMKLLTGGARDHAVRQQTLRKTIDWSYDLLSAEEKQLFARMAVFQGGCTLQALEEVCNCDETLQVDVLDGVQSLIDMSLLRQREGSDEEAHFRMLKTIQEYAGEKLKESEEAEVLRRAHAIHYMKLAEEAEPHLTSKEQQEWLDTLENEYDNIRAALYWARETASEKGKTADGPFEREPAGDENGQAEALQPVEIGLRTAAAVGRFWNMRGYYSEGWDQLSSLLALDKVSNFQRAGETAKTTATDLNGRYTHNLHTAQKATRARALAWAGVMIWQQRDLSSARSLHEECRAIMQELGDRSGTAWALSNLANVVFDLGEREAAKSMYEQSLAIRRELDEQSGIAVSLNSLGTVAVVEGNYTLARSMYEESLALVRELDDKWSIGIPLYNLGFIAQEEGEYAKARSLYDECIEIYRELGDKVGIAYALAGLGKVEVSSSSGSSWEGTKGSCGLIKGARLLGAVEALLESVNTMLWSVERTTYDQAVEQARTQLGENEFEKAWAVGRAMSMDEAIKYALEDVAGPAGNQE